MKILATILPVVLLGIISTGSLSADNRLVTVDRLLDENSRFTTDWRLAQDRRLTDGSLTENELSAANDEQSIIDQQSIIDDYLWVTGQIKYGTKSWSLGAESNSPIKCGTPAIVRFQTIRDKLDRDLLQSLGVTELTRPSLDAYFDSPGGHFRIHYATFGVDTVYNASVDLNANSVPDYIDTVAMIADSVWDIMINQLGYPEPAVDTTSMDIDTIIIDTNTMTIDTLCAGDGGPLYDIYVSDLSSGVYGQTWFDLECADPGTLLMEVPTFMEIDNDFQHIAWHKAAPLNAARVTIAHEFLHAVQVGMDFTEFTSGVTGYGNIYWGEMSATWMEEKIYDDINDYYYYLPAFFQYPNTSFQQFLESSSDLHPYGSVVFPLFLSQKYGDDIIRLIWEKQVDLGIGPNFLEAAAFMIDSLSDGNDSYATAFSEFALWNFFTGFRLAFAPAGIGYEEALAYPQFSEQKIAVYDSFPVPLVTANANPFKPEHNAVSIIRFENTQLVQEDRFYRCVDSLHYYNLICDQDSTISVEVTDTNEVWDATDSSFSIILALESMLAEVSDDTLLTDWSVSLVFQDTLDSIEIDQLYLPSINCGKEVCLPAFSLIVDRVNRFKRITMIIAPASPYESLYVEKKGRRVAYVIREIMSGDTAATFEEGYTVTQTDLIIYPNPALVANMTEEEVKFRLADMEVTGDPFIGLPSVRVRTVLNMFDVAGNIVYSVDTTSAQELMEFFGEGSGPLEVAWNMKNRAGQPVASGVYVGIAEIYINRQRVAVGTGKVAIIR